MFQIVINNIQQSYLEIEKQISKRSELILETKEILKNLRRFSEVDDITFQMELQITQLEAQQKQFIQLLQALNVVIGYYETCEKRIISNSELGNRWTFNVTLNRNDFIEIVNQLQSIKLI